MRKDIPPGFKTRGPIKRAMGGPAPVAYSQDNPMFSQAPQPQAPQASAQQPMAGAKQPRQQDISLTLSKEAYKKNPRESIDGYNIDRSLSNKRTRTYHNPETNQTVIAHRGTKPTDMKDLKNDFLIATGMFNKKTSSRIRNAGKIAKGAEEKYGSNISNVGHSLGGTMAQKTGRKLRAENSKVVGYNPGSSPLDIPKNIYNSVKNRINPNSNASIKARNVTTHTTGLDPISMSAMFHPGKTVIKKPRSVNTHSLDNW